MALSSPSLPDLSSAQSTSLPVLIWQSLPALLAFSLFGAMIYWGHRHHWRLPQFSTLAGARAATPDDWCLAHGVPDSVCVECHPELLPRGTEYGWCKLHGVNDCPLCHPDVAQLPAVPRVTADALDRARRALDFVERPPNSRKCELRKRRLQFPSAEAVEHAGIEVVPAWEAPVAESVAASGEITYDPNRVARLSSRVTGTVWRVEKQSGDLVRKGDVLLLIESAEVGKFKAEFLQAFAQVEVRGLVHEGLVRGRGTLPERSLHESEAALREARIRLLSARQALINFGLPVPPEELLKGLKEEALARRVQFLGLPDSLAATFDPATTTANLLPIRAPLDGTLVSRDAVEGESVETTKVLCVVADVRRTWLTLDVRLEDAQRLRVGQLVRFRPDGGQGEVTGQLSWLSTGVNRQTRTVKARADLDNADGRLRDHTFGTGRVILRQEQRAIVVPEEAVHWDGDCHVVFVRDRNFLDEGTPKVFHARQVRTGAHEGGAIEIIAGVLPGEVVAGKGSSVLRAELLKNSLGEG